METTAETNPTPKRPALVWVITVYYAFSLCFTMLSFALVRSGVLPTPPEAKEYFENLSAPDYVQSFGPGVITLIAVVLLFMLRKRAILFFSVSLVLSVLVALVQALTSNYLLAAGVPGLFGMLIGWGIQAGVLIYAVSLRRKGILT